MPEQKTYPDFSGNACALLSEEDREKLWRAACTLVDERGLVVRIGELVGGATEWAGAKASGLADMVLKEGWRDKVQQAAEEALWRAHDAATFGMDSNGTRDPWDWLNKLVVSATGATAGFFGLPGALVEVPFSTLVIMRSISEIAREHGEDIGSDDGRRACLQVIAFGGPGVGDDDAEVGYWSTRMLLGHATIEIILKRAAAQLGAVLSEKLLAQAVPIVGALAGGSLNYLFMDFYQQMARVHFTIRALERKHGAGDDGSVRACLDHLVRQARERRHVEWPEPASSGTS